MARKSVETNISYDQDRNTYYVYMDYGQDASGRRIRKYRTYPTLPQARSGLRAFLAEREAQPVPPSAMTLDQWLTYWMEQVVTPSRAATTAYGYHKIIENHLSPALGGIPIQELTPCHIQCYYTAMLQKQLTPNTVRRHHDLLQAALHTAVRQEVLRRSPTDRVDPPRSIRPDPLFYGPDQLKQLYALAKDTSLELPIQLAGGLGLRREEICGLKWCNVDFQLRRIHICAARTTAGAAVIEKDTKNRSSTRVLHMREDLFHLLRREWSRQSENRLAAGGDYQETGLVLVTRTGTPWSPNALSLAFTRFVRRHNLPKLTLHGLRHTFATVASAQGAPLYEIGRALGHSTPSTTGRIYTHLLDQTHEATLDKVANALK